MRIKSHTVWIQGRIFKFFFCFVILLSVIMAYSLVKEGALVPFRGTSLRSFAGPLIVSQSNLTNVTSSQIASKIRQQNSLDVVNNSTKYTIVVNSSLADNGVSSLLRLKYIDCCGLGNKMFMYASLLGIARAQGRQPYIYAGVKIDQTFELTHVVEQEPQDVETWPTVRETAYAKFTSTLMNISGNFKLADKNVTIIGQLQSWRYFTAIEDEIRREFIFKSGVRVEVMTILDNVRKTMANNGSLIGIHVRRGDFTKPKQVEQGYTTPNRTYFQKAIDWMREKLGQRELKFLVVSNDRQWCEDTLHGIGAIIMLQASQAFDLAILAHCDHVIIAGGTYGWWGAWLAGGHVVYYNGFPRQGSAISKGMNLTDYYPPQWVGLGD